MFNPGMNIQNILLKQLVMKSLENLERIFNYLPHCKIILNWIPGTDNPSDFLSKLVMDPVKESNSPFYKTGPATFESKSTIMANRSCYSDRTMRVELLSQKKRRRIIPVDI